ncbi:MAG: hypothetical protein K8U57_21325 [Planctomycetes bacterium]|nr:hypothetical protein [Planctomycetota bacterium]
MNSHPSRITPHIGSTHVWSDLPDDLQQRAVRLLAQLAYAQLRQTTQRPTQEMNDDHPTQHQDSPRPS